MEKNKNCTICDGIGFKAFAVETHGAEYEFIPFPPQAFELIPIDDLVKEEGHASNEIVKAQKRKCPNCGQIYQYRSVMTYFVHFIEFSEFLERI